MDDVEFLCSECGNRAATIRLDPPRGEPADQGDIGYDQWQITIDGPVQVTYWVLRALEELKAALREGSVAALLNVDPNYVNFWCRHCLAIYCKDHWEPIEPVMEDGFYDATYGTCPKGHRVMLDD